MHASPRFLARLPCEHLIQVELRHRDESEATELLTASFALTPEPLMDWLCGPEHPLERDATGTATSTSVGNKKRLEIVRGLMRWSFVTCLLYGCVLVGTACPARVGWSAFDLSYFHDAAMTV